MFAPLTLMVGLLLCLAGSSHGTGYNEGINYWEAFAPGKLLQRLDSLTQVDNITNGGETNASRLLPAKRHTNATSSKETAHRKADEYEDHDVELDSDDVADHAEEIDSHSGEVSREVHDGDDGDDYERNYEQFVRQYFDRVHDSNGEDDGSKELDVSLHSGSVEKEFPAQLQTDYDYESAPYASTVKKTKQREEGRDRDRDRAQDRDQQHCKRILRHGQLCTICRELRNNEISETCSYSHEGEPQRYAYGSGTQYKRYRDDSVDSEGDNDEARSLQRPMAIESSLCVRSLHKQRVCYECKDSDGEKMRRCYNAHEDAVPPRTPPSKPLRKSHNAEQRIYKRTVTYAYDEHASDHENDGKSSTARPTPLATSKNYNPNLFGTGAVAGAVARNIRIIPMKRQRHRRTVVKVLRTNRRSGI
ncbi:uncharacterized protein LOC115629133 [Scaptodrosophila lebanonensis]|uniref:Uncharacterized protein LOC115629133 n=1 Tax=Drosophila lebanonensis TaxID=7225 RepID=A0A6J2U0A9_DROLE|nr:uncharacterized protein LOC115629133 [Scaptodrosophila lebanonensis]